MPVILFKLSVCFGGLAGGGARKTVAKNKNKSLIKVQGTDSKIR